MYTTGLCERCNRDRRLYVALRHLICASCGYHPDYHFVCTSIWCDCSQWRNYSPEQLSAILATFQHDNNIVESDPEEDYAYQQFDQDEHDRFYDRFHESGGDDDIEQPSEPEYPPEAQRMIGLYQSNPVMFEEIDLFEESSDGAVGPMDEEPENEVIDLEASSDEEDDESDQDDIDLTADEVLDLTEDEVIDLTVESDKENMDPNIQ